MLSGRLIHIATTHSACSQKPGVRHLYQAMHFAYTGLCEALTKLQWKRIER